MKLKKDLLVHRIIAGCIICEFRDHTLLVKQPTKLQRYMAEEIYFDTLEKAELAGSYTDEQLMELLLKHKFWNNDKQILLDSIPKNIEDFKVGLFNSTFNSVQRNTIRKALSVARKEQEKLLSELHEYDYISAKGVAQMAKARYIVAASLYNLDGTKLFDENNLWLVPNNIIESIGEVVSKNRLDESTIRELARTDPWRTIWIAKKAENNVFGIPAVDLSDDQRMLSIWSSVYDNIYEHPECPSDEVMNDDDMLDGWMIAQKRKRDSSKGASVDDIITNEKVRGSEEIFIPVGNAADAQKVMALNDASAARLLQQRMDLVKQKGVVKETEMPDSQAKIREQITQQYLETRRQT
jgi:hypothetical protein